jgi:seryl-tRNA synthetase
MTLADIQALVDEHRMKHEEVLEKRELELAEAKKNHQVALDGVAAAERAFDANPALEDDVLEARDVAERTGVRLERAQRLRDDAANALQAAVREGKLEELRRLIAVANSFDEKVAPLAERAVAIEAELAQIGAELDRLENENVNAVRTGRQLAEELKHPASLGYERRNDGRRLVHEAIGRALHAAAVATGERREPGRHVLRSVWPTATTQARAAE